MKKTIEIFAPGTWVAQDGKSYTFTEDQVKAIAEAYDPVVFSAPAVIGHPKHDDPAYGWASQMRFENGKLVADLDKVAPEFAEAVEAGRYRKVSLSLYAPGQKGNPLPGQYYPRHIGFLGAAAPGVKGLAPVEFAEGDEFLEFASDEELRPLIWLARTVGRVFGSIREYLIEQHGREEADKVLGAWEADAPAEIAGELQEALKPASRSFAEGSEAKAAAPRIDDADLQAATAELDARRAELDARELAFAERQREARVQEDEAFLDELVEAGRLPPGLKPTVAAFCEALAQSQAICFAEGEQARPPREAFRDLLGQLGQTIRFDEVADPAGVRFAEGADGQAYAAAIQAEMSAAAAAGRPITAAEAAARVKAH